MSNCTKREPSKRQQRPHYESSEEVAQKTPKGMCDVCLRGCACKALFEDPKPATRVYQLIHRF
eukprot:1141595-Amphidinium_carterae.1